MSEMDGLTAGSVTLEGDTPTIVGGPPVAAPVAPVEPATPPVEEETVEGVTLDLRGQKLVPLQALQAARADTKALKAQLHAAQDLQAEVETLRGKAQTADQVSAWVESVRPLLTKLKDRPDLVQQVMSGAPAPVVAPTAPVEADVLSPADAEELARTLELYTPEGQPDLVRAQKMARINQKMAAKQAAETFAPVREQMAAGQSGTLRTQYAAMKDKAGRTVSPQVLDQMWNLVPAELIARDPNVAGVLYYAAKGYAAHHGLDEPSAPPSVPVVTETPGGQRSPQHTLTELDRRFARTMGSEKTYTETAAHYRPGAINVLE